MKEMKKIAIWLCGWVLLCGCMEEGKEAQKVILPVISDGSGMSDFVNPDGYSVEIEHLAIAIANLEFTIRGETHEASVIKKIRNFLFPIAYAHPGHLAGGEVTGQLDGNFILCPTSGENHPLGDAVLLEGEYHGMNFTFRKATATDKSSPDDPIEGHTIYVSGKALRDGKTYDFSALVDIDEGTKMVGAPFTLNLDASEPDWTLAVRVLSRDPSSESDTLFDGIDFESLDEDRNGKIEILPGTDAHNILKRRFQVHDHYWVEPTK